MNSEELELSLRTEFESYLKGVLADLRQDVSEFQKNFEAEFDKHKAQTDEAFRNLARRFESDPEFGPSFSESVVEHLRLARDDGATITAAAFGEAEKLNQETAPAADFDKLRDAINEISRKTSQSEILKSLVDHASNFTPRGAFFIVKNEHFVGWKAFGKESVADELAVRNIQFPISAKTVLADAIGGLGTITGSNGGHTDDNLFLDPLEFGKPDRMYAIPLTARGRGVAVLYADYGNEGVRLNAEALETLVRVAGLTVELIASAQPAPVQPEVSQAPAVREPEPEPESTSRDYAPESAVADYTDETAVADYASETAFADYKDEAEVYRHESIPEVEVVEDEFTESPVEPVAESFEEAAAVEEPEVETVETFEEYTGFVSVEEPEVEEAVVEEAVVEEPAVQETSDFAEYGEITAEEPATIEAPIDFEAAEVEEITYFEPVEESEVTEAAFSEPLPESEFVASDPFDAVAEEPEVVVNEDLSGDFEPQVDHSALGNGNVSHPVTEPLAEVATAQAARTRYRDRNVDLPIEVADDERRLHNDARRFARLLVSEIKLYNEQKVTEGRETGDLYDRLREAIDRSRDMYDKRVQEPVAARFDYFHYELVNSLADGEDVRLGASYPGAKVPA